MRSPLGQCRSKAGRARERGSVYILVLGASLLVAVIGISSLMAARVQRRSTTLTADRIQACELARSGIDFMMYGANDITTNSVWRAKLNNGDYTNVAFGGGTFTVVGVDPNDGDLINNNGDPVVLTCTGDYRKATYILRVTVDGDGTPQLGTWKHIVN